MINGFADLTIAGTVHTVLSLAGIMTGAEQVLRKQRDQLHRRLGYVYVASMLVADVAVLTVYRFSGGFNAFHAGALVNMACIGMAMRPMLTKPRPPKWKLTHYMWICWSYVGLLAAASTELLIRTQPIADKGTTIIVTIAASISTALVGAALIRRHRPKTI